MKLIKVKPEDVEWDHIHISHYPLVLRKGEYVKLTSGYYIQRKTKPDKEMDRILNWWSWYNIKRYLQIAWDWIIILMLGNSFMIRRLEDELEKKDSKDNE